MLMFFFLQESKLFINRPPPHAKRWNLFFDVFPYLEGAGDGALPLPGDRDDAVDGGGDEYTLQYDEMNGGREKWLIAGLSI